MRPSNALLQCQDLKDNVIVNDEIKWENRLQLQQLLERTLLSDVDFGLSKQAEQTLWNSCFKSCIDFYQAKIRHRKTDEDAALLSMFLTSSIGFFAQFLSKLCRYYHFNVNDCFKSDANLGILNGHWDKPRRSATKLSLHYIAQFCLIHLGDIARYQKRLNEAESFYVNACRVSPTNGHPFNQLAILETSRNKNLSAIYLYTRSLYVENPFTLASTNLDKFYSTVDLKLQTQSYVAKFFKFISVIHLMAPNDLLLAENDLIKIVCEDLKSAILSENLSCHDVMHIFVITVGCVWKINSSRDSNSLNDVNLKADDEKIVGFSTDEKRCLKLLVEYLKKFFVVILEIVSGGLDNLMVVAKLNSDWFKNYFHMIKYCGFCEEKSQLLPVLCKFLNYIQVCDANNDNNSIQSGYILPEDQEMQGFLPLELLLEENAAIAHDSNLSKTIRRQKLLGFGHFVVNSINDNELLSAKKVQKDDKTFIEFSTKIVFEEVVPVQKKSTSDEKSVKFKTEIVEEKIISSPEQGKTSKRQTKVLPLLTIFEKEKSKDGSDKENSKSNEQPKFKIAPPGSKVDLPLAAEKKDEDDEEKLLSNDSTTNSEKARYELPPRFQAAKLKSALSGAPSFGNFERRMPDSSRGGNFADLRMPTINLTSFPPLIPPPSWSGIPSQSGMMGPSPSEFHKTPGVRPRGPPPFPHLPMPFASAPPPGFVPPRSVPDLSRPPPPFMVGNHMDSAVNSNLHQMHPPSMWPQNSMYMPSEDLYYQMWQPKSSNAGHMPVPAPPNPEEIWNLNFDWTKKESSLIQPTSSHHVDEEGGRQLPYFTNSAQSPVPLSKPTPGFNLQYHQQVVQNPNPNDVAHGSVGSESERDDENGDQKLIDGQFSLFGSGSGNPFEYSKWSTGNN